MSMVASEITPQQAEALRATGVPAGMEIVEVEDVPWAGHSFRPTGSGLLVPGPDPVRAAIEAAEIASRPKPVAVELFTGGGGFSLGVHQADFDVVAGVEWEPAAAYTYLSNLGHPDCAVFVDADKQGVWDKLVRTHGGEWGQHYAKSQGWQGQAGARTYWVGDVRRITGAQIKAAAGVERVDLLFGGPPCQGLSTANAKAAIQDLRNALLWEFMRMVEELNPTMFMIENVPSLFSAGKGALIEALASKAVNAGYQVTGTVVDAVHYGVPQHRRRAIVVGTRDGMKPYAFPMPTHWSKGWTREGKRWWYLENYEQDRVGDERVEAVYDSETRTWSLPVEDDSPQGLGPLFEGPTP